MMAPDIPRTEGFGFAADKGARENQEDSAGLRVLHDGALAYVLCDGMGGHAAGEVASGEAVRAFLDHLGAAREVGQDTWQSLLQQALIAANDAIREKVNADAQLEGMGCTLVGVISDSRQFAFVSVGDSPLYLSTFAVAPGISGAHRLLRINTDHSLRDLVERKARETGQPFEAIAAQINPNALRSALVGQPLDIAQMRADNELDLGHRELHAGDRLIAASDGIETLNDEDLARLAENRDIEPQAQAQMLLQQVLAVAKPGQDNTAILVHAAGPSASALPISEAAISEIVTEVVPPSAPAPEPASSGAVDAKRRAQAAAATKPARGGGGGRWALVVIGAVVLAGAIAYFARLISPA